MATIGLSLESGSMYAVLFDPRADAVVANRMTPLDGGVADTVPAALDGMHAAARRRKLTVDAVGVVYSSDAERTALQKVFDDCTTLDVSMVSASSSFLGWLGRSSDFADAHRVLLYYVGDAGVSISLADIPGATLTPAKTATLASIEPEKIGSTVPLAWEVLDEAGVEADSVALFGDRSESRDLVDILSLGLELPVIRVSDPDQVAARGAALLAAASKPVKPVDLRKAAPTPAAVEAEPEKKTRAEAEAEPAASQAATTISSSLRRTPPSRRKIVLAAALLAAVFSGGVALASTLPGEPEQAAAPTTAPSHDATEIDTSLAGATSSVVIAAPPETTTPAPAAPETVDEQPVYVEPVPVTWESVDPTVPVPWTGTVETITPIPAQAIPPNAAAVPTTVDPPQFTIPPVIPEPGKSQEQLEQEAWDRHWQHTAEWLEQEIVGN
ncbi:MULTISPECIES: hypothetical protein [unclassified Rhodococcus (in: high G+C Gram-positive bacteria)]|uniref:hypothetical protein n=1 Tax=unclassified Rhodococcus (in: high G+C Gram-positive bacteria) TaxID=192944 RepID=UPI0027DF8B57|nr:MULTISPECIES: hypothetical protein [unclassified Rhodococcus (in: high G+C Gram-positive bacteria)]